jgi:iron complex transport system ATP-binding protein
MKLNVQNFSVIYGKKTVLNDLNLKDISTGQLIGILGPNGVGKSTFLKAIAGQKDFIGQVTIDDENLLKMSARRRSGLISYLPQMLPQGTSLVAYEAVISALRAVRPDLQMTVVERLAEEVFDLLEIRYLAFKSLNQISGGERQMIGLAQILVHRPQLLLLDEPTSALDLRWQLSVLTVIKKMLLEHKALCLIAIHDINLAMRHCDKIILMDSGNILAFGPPEEALTRKNLNQAYQVDGTIDTNSNGHNFFMPESVLSEQSTNTNQ